VPFWDFSYGSPSRGENPKETFGGMNRRSQAKLAKITKCAHYQNYCIDSNQILLSNKDHQMPFVGGPNTCNTAGRHLGEIEKSSYFSNILTLKNLKFQNP